MSWIIVLFLTIPVFLALILLLNVVTFPRLGRYSHPAQPVEWPSVSILIPARNEAGVIGSTVDRLLAQQYPGRFEVQVLDDNSQDATAKTALDSAGEAVNFKLISGQPLPPGWTGKNWACWQLAEAASGDILVFTDADVAWSLPALQHLVGAMTRLQADMLTVWPRQITHSWGERLVVPMMMFTTLCYLPEVCVRFLPWPVFSAANGQCLTFRKGAYWRIGGHRAVKNSVLDDMSLARAAKHSGLKLAMALSDGLICTRMYTGWRETREGFAKNILAGHGNMPVMLVLSGVFHWMFFLIPFVWLFAGWALPGRIIWPQIPAAMAALALAMRALSASTSRERVRDAIFLPVTTILFTVIAAQSLWWRFRRGGMKWKGRHIPAQG